MVQGAAERGHDGGPRARAGAAERVALVFLINCRVRRRRVRLHLDGGLLCLVAKLESGGQPRRALLRRGRGATGESIANRWHAAARRAPRFAAYNTTCEM